MEKNFHRLDVLDIPKPLLLRIAVGSTLLFALFRSTPMYVMGGEPIGFAFRQFGFTCGSTLLLWGMNILLFKLMLPFSSPYSRWWRMGISLIISVVLGWLLLHFVVERFGPPMPRPGMMPPPPPHRRPWIIPVLQVVSVNLLILMVMEMMMMKRARDRVARENDALRMASLEARINSLKAQLHPHFLFNALSALKALNRQSPERVEHYIDGLAALLRSSLKEGDALIPLQEEYALCMKYLDLQKLRFGHALEVELIGEVGGQDPWLIPMYSLQQLAENAIKHNALSTEAPLSLRIRFDARNGSVTTMNNLQPRAGVDPGEGIGLRNLNERCILLGLGPIERETGTDDFSITIKLKRA